MYTLSLSLSLSTQSHTHTPTHRSTPSCEQTFSSKSPLKIPTNKPQQKAMPAHVLILLLFLFSISNCVASTNEQPSTEQVPLLPKHSLARDLGFFQFDQTRRKLSGSFQLCAPCTCCGGSKGICLLSPCCYAINCNIPNRPFGFCSFSPKSCDCTSCSL